MVDVIASDDQHGLYIRQTVIIYIKRLPIPPPHTITSPAPRSSFFNRSASALASRCSCTRTANRPSISGKLGHPFNAGHPAPSMTCREGLTALPGHGQLVDL